MIAAGRALTIAVAMLVVAGPGLAAAPLKHDPFARSAPVEQAMAAPGAGATAAETPWNPPLKAVVLAGKDSLVNVGGVVIRLGEHVDGYRLLRVREREAVFGKGSRRVTLKMDDARARPGEERGDK